MKKSFDVSRLGGQAEISKFETIFWKTPGVLLKMFFYL